MESSFGFESMEYFSVEDVENCQCHLCLVLNQLDAEVSIAISKKLTKSRSNCFNYTTYANEMVYVTS